MEDLLDMYEDFVSMLIGDAVVNVRIAETPGLVTKFNALRKAIVDHNNNNGHAPATMEGVKVYPTVSSFRKKA